MRRWEYLIEADTQIAALKRAAASGDTDAVVKYLMALSRAGQEPDLSVVASRREIEKIIPVLWKDKSLELILNDRFPFGYPSHPTAVAGVRFVTQLLRSAHGRNLRNVNYTRLFMYVLRWLTRNGQEDYFGRTRYHNSPLEHFLQHSVHGDDDGMTYRVDNYIGMYNTLWYPIPDQAQSSGFHYGELVSIGNHINGGAIYRVGGDGFILQYELFRTPHARVAAWNEWAEEVAIADAEGQEPDDDD